LSLKIQQLHHFTKNSEGKKEKIDQNEKSLCHHNDHRADCVNEQVMVETAVL